MDRPLLALVDRRMAPLGGIGVFGVAIAMVGLLGAIDFLSGREISFSIFYVMPVSLAAWYSGMGSASLIALASAGAWLAADLAGGSTYSSVLIPYWNALVRLGYFLIIARLLALLRERLAVEERLAETDSLTGLRNARSFIEAIEDERTRAGRYGHAFSLAYLDLDDFKDVNDTHGHAAGDDLLKEIAQALSRAVRRTDVVGRLGGDEFAVLLPETGEDSAPLVLHKIHQSVLDTVVDGAWSVGASVGGVTFLETPFSAEAALKAADDVMYEVKGSGKNRFLHRPS